MTTNKRYAQYVNTQSEARWASDFEIKGSGVEIDLASEKYCNAGLPLWSNGKTVYVDGKDNHTLIEGATGSKKTRNVIMPLLHILTGAGESFIINDPKGELYSSTSGYAQERGYKTVVLNFRDIGYGDMWNPLALPYELHHSGKINQAMLMLSDFIMSLAAPFKHGKDAFWNEMATSLALANLSLLIENTTFEECNIAGFVKLCSTGYQENVLEISKLLDENSFTADHYKGVLLKDAETTRECIFASLYAMVRIFSVQPSLTEMLSRNTFDIRKIGKEKTAVYIIVPDEKTTFHFLASVFIKQVYEILIGEAQKEPNAALPVRVNFVLDEFCNMPTIPDMPSMITASRSRNIRFFLVSQGLNQLKSKYKDDAETIKNNCGNRVFFTSREIDLLNEISELCGDVTVPMNTRGENKTAANQTKRLISPSQLQRFNKDKGEALILHERHFPFFTILPDIDKYEAFRHNLEPVRMEPFSKNGIRYINPDELLARVKAISAAENSVNTHKGISI